MRSKAIDSFLIAVGVALMGLELLIDRANVARLSIMPAAVISIYLGARGWRNEPKPTLIVILGCAALFVAAMANLGMLRSMLANILGISILSLAPSRIFDPLHKA
jgi:hypothetical protein